MAQEFIYLVKPIRPGFLEELTSEETKVVEEHFEYLKTALEIGRLVLAGPCVDRTFGVVIFRAQSELEAKKFMEDDPAVKSGVFKSELHVFRVSLI